MSENRELYPPHEVAFAALVVAIIVAGTVFGIFLWTVIA